MKKSFVERFNEVVKEKNVSQTELAKRSGITQSSISDWLKGKYLPKQDKVHALADALNVSPSYLMGWDDEENSEEPPKREKIIMEGFEDITDQMVIKKLKTYKFFSSGVGSVDLNDYEEVEFMLFKETYSDIIKNGYTFRLYDKNLEPLLHEGDVIVFNEKKLSTWEELDSKLLFLKLDGKPYIKKLFFHDGVPYLHTFNERVYPKVSMSEFKNVELIGILKRRIVDQDIENLGI